MSDAQLKKRLLAAAAKPCNFVLAMKGADVALILSVRTITGAQVKEAKVRTKGGKIYRGVVEGGSSGYAFRAEDPLPATAGGPLRKYIKTATGLSLRLSLGS